MQQSHTFASSHKPTLKPRLAKDQNFLRINQLTNFNHARTHLERSDNQST